MLTAEGCHPFSAQSTASLEDRDSLCALRNAPSYAGLGPGVHLMLHCFIMIYVCNTCRSYQLEPGLQSASLYLLFSVHQSSAVCVYSAVSFQLRCKDIFTSIYHVCMLSCHACMLSPFHTDQFENLHPDFRFALEHVTTHLSQS